MRKSAPSTGCSVFQDVQNAIVVGNEADPDGLAGVEHLLQIHLGLLAIRLFAQQGAAHAKVWDGRHYLSLGGRQEHEKLRF